MSRYSFMDFIDARSKTSRASEPTLPFNRMRFRIGNAPRDRGRPEIPTRYSLRAIFIQGTIDSSEVLDDRITLAADTSVTPNSAALTPRLSRDRNVKFCADGVL
ncbi:hypothetical protein HN011_005012 [Eciton burchellii]|nr:hypothetical protein HN011_005012 [Eciton burchellii]